jgi:chaperonin GroEL
MMELKKPKSQRGVFVIMPFVTTPTRNQAQLTSFFENNLRRPIEEASLKYEYTVWRSGETFNITDEIIKDLFRADIVIADLSGEYPNPNVMYELGVRLALSEEPVILIRERNPYNKKVFDVDNYYVHQYDPLNYTELERHLLAKIDRLEKGEESFESPVKKVLHDELILSQSRLSGLTPSQQKDIVLKGANLIRANISISFGPSGKGMPIKDRNGAYTLAKRGYDITKATWSSNPLENRGIEFISEVARTMLQKVGDGSKVAILLACEMMESGNEALKKGHLAKHIISGMKKAVNEAISYIQENAHLLRDQHEVASVATTASKNGDIGRIIAECLGKVGKLGIIKFKRSGFAKTSVETIEGIQFDRGYISPEFVTGQDSASWISDKCHILLYPGVISSLLEVLPLMEETAKSKSPLLIIAQDVREAAIETLLLNLRKGVIKAVAVGIPATDDGGISLLMDIAIKTGGQIVGPSTGLTLAHIDVKDLGVAERVVVTGNYTRIIGGEGGVEEIKRRTKQIDEALASASNVYEAEKYRDRLAMLAGATAIVDVGGVTLQEADENLYGFESALNSAMSGISYGAIPGGGVSLLMAKERVATIRPDDQAEKSGIESVLKSLESPLSCLISNSNLMPEQITDQIRLRKSSSDGFNAETGNIENLLTAGIIDPVEMLIKALEIALSHTKMFLETTTWADQKSLDIGK